MTPISRISYLSKTVATTTAAGLVSLSLAHSAPAFDTSAAHAEAQGRVVGLALTGNLDFSRFQIMGFSQQSLPGLSGSSERSDDTMFYFDDGVATTRLPLLTFGYEVNYPGLFYNQKGEQLFDHLARAAEGEQQSQEVLWPYIFGGTVMVGAILIFATGGSDDDDPAPVIEEPVPVDPVEPAPQDPPTDPVEPPETDPEPAEEPVAETTP